MPSARKKVLFLIPSLIPGGAQRVFSTLLRHLDRGRFELHLAVLQATGAYMADVPEDVVVHNLKVARIRHALPAIIKIVWKVKPDTVLSTLVYLNLQLLLAKPFLPAKTRVLVRESTTASSFLAQETRHPELWKRVYRNLHRRADRIICLSQAMMDDLGENFDLPREKLVLIYNPIDFEMIRRMADAERNPYHGPGPHLVSAGRLSREKGMDVLLRAMPAVLEALPHARLAILGGGPLTSELKQQAERLHIAEAVDFLGFRQNPWPYFKHADVFVLPSRYEGLPNALLEALALGALAVAADCPGAVREIPNPEGRIVLAAPQNQDALSKAIVYQCGRARAPSLSRHCADAFLNGFSLTEVVSEYTELLMG
jgi:glycosyltransferase involved in cell wall biosynthesis